MSIVRRYFCVKMLLAHGWKMLSKSIYRKGSLTVLVDSDGYIHFR